MKTPDKNSKANPGRQRKQQLLLGGLVLLLAGVLSQQMGGDDDAPLEVAALADTATAAAASEPESLAALGEAVPSIVVRDNPVLSKPLPAGEEELTRSPFTSFWVTTNASTGVVMDLQAPAVQLNLTLPSEVRPVAIIDGRVCLLGDDIHGWELTEVRARAVVLRSPTNSLTVVEMPLLGISRPLPGAITGR